MTKLQDYLRNGDPLNAERDLAPDVVNEMRDMILGASHARARTTPPVMLAVAAVLSAAACVAVWFVRTTPLTSSAVRTFTESEVTSPGATSTRQVIFATPGGTRVIWLLDPSLETRHTQ